MSTGRTYQSGVLIGNWYEDKCKYKKASFALNSSYRADYQQNGYQKPDSTVRRNGWVANDGLPPKFLLYHHGNRYMDNQVTWYDEDYNHRARVGPDNHLPPLRQFSTHVMAWVPEKSDHPIRGTPTTWGLVASKQNEWEKQMVGRNTSYTPLTEHRDAYVEYSSDVLNDARRKKYDVSALTASSVLSAGKSLDPIHVAAGSAGQHS